MKLWILVADDSRARVFASAGRWDEPREVRGFVHPAGRQHGTEITTDRPGRARLAGSTVTAMPPRTDPREVEAERFAAELAQAMGRSRERGEFDALALVAPPRFLGLLRDGLDEQTRQRVVACEHKDLTLMARTDLPRHLSRVVEAASQAAVT